MTAVEEIGSPATRSMTAEILREDDDLLWRIYEIGEQRIPSRDESVPGTRIYSQTRVGDEWVTRAEFDVAPECSLIAFRGAPGSSVRAVLTGSHELLGASGKARGGLDGENGMTLVMAHHSRLGPVLAGIAEDLGPAEVSQNDTLTLTYEPGEVNSPPRDWFLLFRRLSTPPPTMQRSETSRLPREFHLAQNQPNPFASTTTIRFELPRPEHVVLDVFDAQGRRVATLANAAFEAGTHAVNWDRVGHSGIRVEPGVFVYRIQAGSFRDHKKLVLLP